MKTKDLLDELKKHIGKHLKVEDDLIVLKNDWDSYRGSYDYMAIDYVAYKYENYSDNKIYITSVDGLIAMIEDMEGNVRCGWKGGEYTPDFEKPIVVSNYGVCSGKIIGEIEDKDWYINLKLKKLTYEF